MNIYEHNFERLVSLLPALFSACKADNAFPITLGGMHLDVLEKHKYTTVIQLKQDLPLSLPPAALAAMTVRVYHDARVAEVLSYQDHYRFIPKYDYPNPKMCQRREKQRVNDFLGEWLDHCLSNRRLDSLSVSSI